MGAPAGAPIGRISSKALPHPVWSRSG
ncbi:MAG: hypothetical protein QOI68_2396, partial [Pseudonocardiales bacterium]|nr:hypothetical protein [Pseudonocardiales bacterium]